MPRLLRRVFLSFLLRRVQLTEVSKEGERERERERERETYTIVSYVGAIVDDCKTKKYKFHFHF